MLQSVFQNKSKFAFKTRVCVAICSPLELPDEPATATEVSSSAILPDGGKARQSGRARVAPQRYLRDYMLDLKRKPTKADARIEVKA